MNVRNLALSVLASGIALATGSAGNPADAQSTALEYASGEPHPVTEWGDPDLRGTWPIQHLIGTPFQRDLRPKSEGGWLPERGDLTEEEYQALILRQEYTDAEYETIAERTDTRRNARYDEEDKSNRIGMGHWAETTDTLRINSLLVDPPNGQFPALTPRGQELGATMGSSWSRETSGRPFDSVADFDTWDRCITRGLPPSMFPFNYNNGIRIHQAPGVVVVELEMIHEARVIPVDGRPPLDPAIKQWMGESRGHWEGSTLVIETTNFNGIGGMTNVGIPGSPRGDTPTTTNMKITERLTRVSPTQIDYSMTVEDPEVLTAPWTARYPMYLEEDYEFFEYACAEDNTAVRNFIETSRYERAKQAEQAANR
jgi:hypothetical protein